MSRDLQDVKVRKVEGDASDVERNGDAEGDASTDGATSITQWTCGRR